MGGRCLTARELFTHCLVAIRTRGDPAFHSELIQLFTAVRLAIAVVHQEMKLWTLESVQLRNCRLIPRDESEAYDRSLQSPLSLLETTRIFDQSHSCLSYALHKKHRATVRKFICLSINQAPTFFRPARRGQ
jgi:hypothetical protein